MRNWITVSKAFVVGVNPSKQKTIKLPTSPVVGQKETIQDHMNPDKQQYSLVLKTYQKNKLIARSICECPNLSPFWAKHIHPLEKSRKRYSKSSQRLF